MLQKKNKHYNIPHHHHLIKGRCIFLDCPLADKPKVKKKANTFGEYLRDRHIEANSEILDDELPDHFDEWACNLSLEEITDHADVFAMQMSNKN